MEGKKRSFLINADNTEGSLVGSVGPFSVVRDIGNLQINELLEYTKNDIQIKKYTHDSERFKSKRSYSAWRKKGKFIYTLVDEKASLLGIIWFGKNKDSFNFAIRLYSSARGKGLALDFMKVVFNDFDPEKKRVFNLTTQKDNIPAIKLYKKFGFKKEMAGDTEVSMTFQYRES